MNIASTLATRAYTAYDYLSMLFPREEAPLDGRPSLYEMPVAMTIKSVAMVSDPGALGAVALTAAASVMPTQGHHSIPTYMCGGRSRELVDIGIAHHATLHAQLLLFKQAINVAGVTYQVLDNRRMLGAPQPPLYKVVRTPYGRQAIAAGLSAFYQLGGWASMGRGRTSSHPMIFVLMKEAMKFSTYNHTWPGCSR